MECFFSSHFIFANLGSKHRRLLQRCAPSCLFENRSPLGLFPSHSLAPFSSRNILVRNRSKQRFLTLLSSQLLSSPQAAPPPVHNRSKKVLLPNIKLRSSLCHLGGFLLSPESSVSFVSLIFDKWQEKVSGKIYRVKCSDLTTDFIVIDEELLSRTKSGRKVV